MSCLGLLSQRRRRNVVFLTLTQRYLHARGDDPPGPCVAVQDFVLRLLDIERLATVPVNNADLIRTGLQVVVAPPPEPRMRATT